MSSIHLDQVSKTYDRGRLWAGAPGTRGLAGTQSDRAFADLGATVADLMGIGEIPVGTSFVPQLLSGHE